MANIKTHLNNIKDALYGKDVRNSIHDAIEQCYTDASINGNANMEVTQARGEYETLGERLDDHASQLVQNMNEISEQLNAIKDEKASKEDVSRISSGTPLFAQSTSEMNDTTRNYVNTTDGYLYIYSEGSWENSNVKYQETGLSNSQVTPIKTNFMVGRKDNKNLFDR